MVTNLTPGSDNPSRGGRGDGVSGRRVDERGPGPGVAQQYRSTRTARTRNARIRDYQTLLAARTIYGEPNCDKNKNRLQTQTTLLLLSSVFPRRHAAVVAFFMFISFLIFTSHRKTFES